MLQQRGSAVIFVVTSRIPAIQFFFDRTSVHIASVLRYLTIKFFGISVAVFFILLSVAIEMDTADIQVSNNASSKCMPGI